MINTTANKFDKNLTEMLKQPLLYGECVNIVTDEGNVILISEQEYNGMLATLELLSNPKMKKKLVEGMKTPISECIDEDEVNW